MSRIVLDASVGLALVRAEPSSTRIAARMHTWAGEKHQLIVPDHFWLEVSNSLGRRHGWSSSMTFEALHELDEFRITTVTVDRALVLLAVGQMERFSLSSYDAAYLALAETAQARLATLDRRLLQAAGSMGVDPSAEAPGSSHRLSEEDAPYGEPAVAERPVTWPQWSGAGSYLGTLRRRALAEAEAANARRG